MDFITEGYEDMELSTQILIKEALSRNIKVDVLDGKDNFIRLSKNSKVEYIKQATKTSADTYISSLIMENKSVTKIILKENGIRIPEGKIYYNKDYTLKEYDFYSAKSIVVKPNNTNFGIGVRILKNGFIYSDFEKSVIEAFNHDTSILVEEFIDGLEYRFLVINDIVVGILHRVPANVVGDGISSIRKLVEAKNNNPLRGKGYKTPLEKINLSDVEAIFLKEQGKDFDYIPLLNETVYLRKNSNISTGGDSIDFTDEIMNEYKQIAINSAKAVGAKICGADIIISDLNKKPDNNNHAVIELNFNPALHIHSYPFKGKNRKPEKHVLDLLGFIEDLN